jgi:hypothetical protein
MQSKTDETLADLDAVPANYHAGCFKLFEEYSHRHITETIKNRREAYERADYKARKEIEANALAEILNFQTWLESVRKFTPRAAHYYSVSLKSLLIGLPIGGQIAQLFDIILEKI